MATTTRTPDTAIIASLEHEMTSFLRASSEALDRRVVSPVIVQEFKSAGVAQVVVYMRTPPMSGLAASDVGISEELRSCFTSSPLSRSYAIRRAQASPRRRNVLALAVESDEPDLQYYENLGVMVGTVDPEGLQRLQASEQVAIVTGSPEFSLIRPDIPAGLALAEEGAWGAEALRIDRLWKEGLDGTGILVGHLDTGIDSNHPALKNSISAFTDTDAEGKLVASAARDTGSHGTHTAGTIAGRQRNIGMAPGCQLAGAIVIEGGNHVRRILAGLNWVVGQGVRIINMSFGVRGFTEDFQPLIDVIRQRNILPVVAAGNEGPGTSRSPGNYANVLSVGAIDSSLRMWVDSSSQRFTRTSDPIIPDLVAPGVAVLSAKAGGGFKRLNGTSMATPHVAGLAALLLQAMPSATASQVEAAIFESCRLPTGVDVERANRGFPDAVRALAALTGTTLRTSATRRTAAKRPAPPRKRTAGARKAAGRKMPAAGRDGSKRARKGGKAGKKVRSKGR